MDLEVYYITETLQNLLSIPSPTGYTEDAIEFVENEFKALGIETKRSNKGALIATMEGKDDSTEVTLAAHVDTLGAMVKEIKPNGRIKFTQLGGYSWDTVEGEYVTIKTLDDKEYTGTILTTKASVHVHGGETSSIERNIDNMEIRIDEKVDDASDVKKLGINVGDFIFIDPRTSITSSGFIKSRHLDDKAGVVSLLSIAKYFVDNKIKPDYTTHFFLSTYEEVGHGASTSIPENTKYLLAVDMAAPGEGQTSDEYSVTICAKDSTGPYDYKFRKNLTQLASDEGLNYKVDIYPSYGSDASAALRAGYDVRAALIGPGVDASHSYERTHIEAIQNTIRLATLFLTQNS